MSVVAFPERGGLVGAVAENVRVECARRGWNQSDLARALGWATSTVSKRWFGLRQWQLDDLEDVAKALGVPVQGLLEYTARDSNPEPVDNEPASVWSFAAAHLARSLGEPGRRFELAS